MIEAAVFVSENLDSRLMLEYVIEGQRHLQHAGLAAAKSLHCLFSPVMTPSFNGCTTEAKLA